MNGLQTARSAAFIISLSSGSFAQPALELTTEETNLTPRIWHSNNRNYEQLSESIAELYINLYNGGALPVTKVEVGELGETPSQLMFEKGYFDGSYFPPAMDALICDLNPDHCTRERRAVDFSISSRPTQHIALTEPTTGTWTVQPGEQILVPSLQFDAFTDFTLHSIDQNVDLPGLVVSTTRGCSEFEEICQARIVAENRLLDGIFEDEFSGELYIPTYSLSANLSKQQYVEINTELAAELPPGVTAMLTEQFQPELDDRSNQAIIQILEAAHAEPILRSEKFKASPGSRLAPERQNEIVDRAIRLPGGIAENVTQPWSAVTFNSTVPTSVSSSIQNIHAIHNLPFDTRTAMPDDLAAQINIAVLDGRFSEDACGLTDRFSILYADGDGRISRANPAGCEEDMLFDPSQTLAKSEHGSHVVGIIGSSFEDKIFGANPYAHILGIELPVSDANVLAEQASVVGRMQAGDDQFRPVVYNLSLGYRRDANVGGSADRLLEFIEKKKNAALFVVAAGNGPNGQAGANLRHGCDIRPACADFPNVITVVSAEMAGDDAVRANYSNFHPTEFDIAAIGTNVPSVVTRTQIRNGSGTSQAAPHVAAAASLLMNRHRMPPAMVKRRVIACSNVEFGLIGGGGGLLDIGCMLSVDSDLLVTQGQTMRGRVIRSEPSLLEFDSLDGGPKAVFPFSNILAIGRKDNEFIVFTATGSDGIVANSGLIPAVQNPAPIFKFRAVDSNAIISIPLADLGRWVQGITQ